MYFSYRRIIEAHKRKIVYFFFLTKKAKQQDYQQLKYNIQIENKHIYSSMFQLFVNKGNITRSQFFIFRGLYHFLSKKGLYAFHLRLRTLYKKKIGFLIYATLLFLKKNTCNTTITYKLQGSSLSLCLSYREKYKYHTCTFGKISFRTYAYKFLNLRPVLVSRIEISPLFSSITQQKSPRDT